MTITAGLNFIDRFCRRAALGMALLISTAPLAFAAIVQNTATATYQGLTLDNSQATVILNVSGKDASSALAEISPTAAIINTSASPFSLSLAATINALDNGINQINITAPAGYTNVTLTSLSVGATPLTLAGTCPVPGPGEYCPSVSGQTLSILMGTKITSDATLQLDFNADTPGIVSSASFAVSIDDTNTAAAAINSGAGNANAIAGDSDSLTVSISQSLVLQLTKTANKKEVAIGDVVTYQVEVRNLSGNAVQQTRIYDLIPPGFKYIKGTARLDGAPYPDPSGVRPLMFDLGTFPALVDSNANNRADPGEPGYALLSYQLIVGAGVSPGDYINTAVAADVCPSCTISNSTESKVKVILEPLFDLGTIIGKVFEDKNSDGWQDPDEPGVRGAMVVLDDGSYVLSDEYGRYHFPGVRPGPHLLKLNLRSLSASAKMTTDILQIVTISPGLLAKANFGISYNPTITSIGHDGQAGLMLAGELRENTSATVMGDVDNLTLLINGQPLSLPKDQVWLNVTSMDDMLNIKYDELVDVVAFDLDIEEPQLVKNWVLSISDSLGRAIREISGNGAPPASVSWDGRDQQGELLKGGEIYQYQMMVNYTNGIQATSGRHLFGVNRSSAIALNLAGGAFNPGQDILTANAKMLLSETAALLRKYPQEKIIIEGHTDAHGNAVSNMELSKRRAAAAFHYLTEVEGIDPARMTISAYGSSRPIASNKYAEGRELNRRVEIKGIVGRADRVKLLDQYRTSPQVTVNGQPLAIQAGGRFSSEFAIDPSAAMTVEMTNKQGQSVQARIPVPALEILQPRGEIRLPYPALSNVNEPSEMTHLLEYPLVGRTDPGNHVELDGQPLTVGSDGKFTTTLALAPGPRLYTLVVRNVQGYTRIADLDLSVTDRDTLGNVLMLATPIPHLTVQLPPEGAQLNSPLLVISGKTEPNNSLTINNQPVSTQADGSFSTTLTLLKGANTLEVRATDPRGYSGAITRTVTVSTNHLFLLAFADAKFGQMRAHGYVQGAGQSSASEFYSEGRVAYYLKGIIAGKYLITSALNTGTGSFDTLFTNLDQGENDRLLSNLDPDKYYPVYGDNSILVNDVESQGKFYLAVESDEINAIVGNYPVNLTATELAAYQRTLFGARVAYQSLARSRDGQPDTMVMVFGAEVRHLHLRNEIRATGGSLYYLSHRDVIEGSEQISLVVRDKYTGLPLSRIPQQRNYDYTINYDYGRILFNRPLSSVSADARIISNTLLAGNPVIVEVDYETRLDFFEKTATGVRVHKQLNEHIAVGGTYVEDEQINGRYQLQGIDTQIYLRGNTKLITELAASSGSDGETLISTDGGLTYLPSPNTNNEDGQAWKLAAEVDIGEWFNQPRRYLTGAYIKQLEAGFRSSGNSLGEEASQRGVNFNLTFSPEYSLLGRFDQDQRLNLLSGLESETSLTTLQARRHASNWDLSAEYHQQDHLDTSLDTSLAALRFTHRPTDKLTTEFTHQQTLTGADNDQSSLALQYQLLPKLNLLSKGTLGSQGNAAEIGLSLGSDQQRAYVTQRATESDSEQSSATIVGSEVALGSNAKLYSEYQWEHYDSDERTVALLGAQRAWEVRQGWRFLLAAEHTSIDTNYGDSHRQALSTALIYSGTKGLSASTRNEIRYENGVVEQQQFLTTNKLDLQLHPDYTLLGRYRYSITRNLITDETVAEFEERSLGLAYRPIAHDRFNALARYTQLYDQRPISLAVLNLLTIQKHVLSLEWSWQFHPKLEWVDKLAVKIKQEQSDVYPALESLSTLSIHRLNYRWTKVIDLSGEYRILSQRQADDQRQGWLTELGWRAKEHLRLGAGFNFTDFSDNEYSDNNYSVYGWFIRLQGMY